MKGFLVVLLFAANVARAAGEGKPKRPTSAEERQSKQYTVDGQPLSFFVGSISGGFTSGVSGGVFYDPETVARVTYRAGRSCEGGGKCCAYVERSLGFAAQRFLSNSFFLEPGLAIQRNIYHPVDNAVHAGEHRRYNFTYNVENWCLSFALGNQWQWGAFTLGARWFAVTQAVFSRESEIHEDSPDEYPKDDRERDRQRQLEVESKLYLPSVAVGASF